MWIRRSGPTIEIQAYAKINLFLEILAKRADGFHELETLLSSIGVTDTVTCTALADSTIDVDCHWAAGCEALGVATAKRGPADLFGPLPAVEDNLVWKAARRLQERSGIARGARIVVTKRTPAAAGLGGASADAAATLAGLNEVWELGWSQDRLAELAGELGSDVPYFLRGGAAVGRGRGERLESLGRMPPIPVVVVRPPEGLSTPGVYKRCRPAESPRSADGLIAALRSCDARGIAAGMKNQLQPPAAELSPWIGCLEKRMVNTGAVAGQMSGSGTSYVAVCRTARQARRTAGAFRAAGLGAVWHTRTPIAG